MDKTYVAPGEAAEIKLADLVIIAEDAGAEIMAIYNGSPADANVQFKEDESPLTAADTAANALICERLQSAYPEIPIMSEELKNAEFLTRADWTLYWCVDPLDGTKEFVKRNGEFTVNIALMAAVNSEKPQEGARPVLGVVHAPVLEKTYFAADSLGAWERASPKTTESSETTSAEAKKISCAEFSESDSGLVLVCSRSHRDQGTEDFIAKFKDPTTKSMGSSLKFMLVATGEAHIYPRLAPTMEWDTAASQIIVEEAGGSVINHDTDKIMRYNKENLLNSFFRVYGSRKLE